VRERARERERDCVCVERECMSEGVWVCEGHYTGSSSSMYESAGVCERESEREREKERGCVCVFVEREYV